jgi:haloacetate dehalogenase
MFNGFEAFDIKPSSNPDVTIHGIKGGSGPPILLLHGFPQTLHIWHLVAAQLTQQYTIIAIDIRGYGASSKPSGIANFAKSVMARDCAIVMETLGYSTYFVCAHDRGARVAHKLLVDYSSRIRKAIFLDICPTLAMYSKTDLEFAKSYFHWFFLIQDAPLPEILISASPRKYAELHMGRRGGLEMFDKSCWEEYVQVLEDPTAVHSMCEDYRASASVDLVDARVGIKDGNLIKTPLRLLWAKKGVIEKCFDAVKEWKDVVAEAGIPIDGHSVDCGHYIAEEAPDEVVKEIRDFFV